MGRIVAAIKLPDAWMDRVLARIHLANEVERVKHQRTQAEQRLRWLGKAFVAGLYSDDDHRREKRNPPDLFTGPEDDSPCFCRRRGRVELGLKHGLAVLVAVSWAGIGIRLLLDRRAANLGDCG